MGDVCPGIALDERACFRRLAWRPRPQFRRKERQARLSPHRKNPLNLPKKALTHLKWYVTFLLRIGLFSVPAPPVRTRERRGFFTPRRRTPAYCNWTRWEGWVALQLARDAILVGF